MIKKKRNTREEHKKALAMLKETRLSSEGKVREVG